MLCQHVSVPDSCHSAATLPSFSWTFFMAYSKAELKISDDKSSPWLTHCEQDKFKYHLPCKKQSNMLNSNTACLLAHTIDSIYLNHLRPLRNSHLHRIQHKSKETNIMHWNTDFFKSKKSYFIFILVIIFNLIPHIKVKANPSGHEV